MYRAKTVDDYLAHHINYQKELDLLRSVILEFPFEENIKWGAPTYSYQGKNLIGLGAFKSYVGLWFFQGGLLLDDHKVLVNAQEGKTKALRQWRFSELPEIDPQLLRLYIQETLDNAKAGREIKAEKKPLILPEELQENLDNNPNLKSAFEKLSFGKKREYAEHIGAAKRAETRKRRMEKAFSMILEGKGLNDKYR